MKSRIKADKQVNKKYKVTFNPSGCTGDIPEGMSVMDAARWLNAEVESPCGGKMKCGKCVVRIETGYFEKYGLYSRASHAGQWRKEEGDFIDDKKREAGFRLACSARVMGPLVIFIPDESRAGKPILSKSGRDIYI